MPYRVLMLMLMTTQLTSGCVGAVIYDGSRNETKNVVSRILAEEMPQVPAAAGADCVLAGMTYGEVLAIGTSDINTIQPKHRAKVSEVLTRAGVQACIAALPVTAG